LTISSFALTIRAVAALYWMAKMLTAGEDPRFVARERAFRSAERSRSTVQIARRQDLGFPDARLDHRAQRRHYRVAFGGMGGGDDFLLRAPDLPILFEFDGLAKRARGERLVRVRHRRREHIAVTPLHICLDAGAIRFREPLERGLHRRKIRRAKRQRGPQWITHASNDENTQRERDDEDDDPRG
jgi:hypothetical protein